MFTVFIMDFDGSYNRIPNNEYGLKPLVYLIKVEEQHEIETLAKAASRDFNLSKSPKTGIQQIFESMCENANLYLSEIGELPILFKERQQDYIAEYIPRVIV